MSEKKTMMFQSRPARHMGSRFFTGYVTVGGVKFEVYDDGSLVRGRAWYEDPEVAARAHDLPAGILGASVLDLIRGATGKRVARAHSRTCGGSGTTTTVSPRGSGVVRCASCRQLFMTTPGERRLGSAEIPRHAPGQPERR